MKVLLTALLLISTMSLAQSPFDGTWVAKTDSIQFSQRPEIYFLQNGTYECTTCVPKISVKADGKDYPMAGSPYFSTIAVQVIDNNGLRITEKHKGKVVYEEVDTLSPDGNTLTQKMTDSAVPSGQPVTAEETLKRVAQPSTGASPICGSWQVQNVNSISENGITVTYQSMPDGLKGQSRNGEGYSAKFDGKEYPVQGAKAHNMVSLQLIMPNTIVEKDLLDGRVHYVVRMTVLPDGKTMKVAEDDLERGTTTLYTMEKKSP